MNQRQVVNVKIKKLHPDARKPKYAHEGDSGFDLVSMADVVIRPGTTEKIPTGLAFGIPDGWEIQIRPRSGISGKTPLRIANAPGTVDSPYTGEVKVAMHNSLSPSLIPEWSADGPFYKLEFGDTYDLEMESVEEEFGKHPQGTMIIRKGQRIAQGVLCAVPIADFEEVDELDETERGNGGFGSSGVKS